MRVNLSTDGAARGNPGPAGIGAVVTDDAGTVLARVAEGIGVATNNVAEYRAAIEGLRAAADLGADEVVLKADSRLLIEQLRGKFRVKNPTLQVLHAEARQQMGRFQRVRLVHVARELNTAADKAANEGVDAWLMSNIEPEPEGPDPSLWDS
ncbi:MAG TPA: ribonuclease HI family protein [Actinomycetota bacterium]